MKVEKVKYLLMAQDMERAVHFYEETFHFHRGYFSEHWSELTFGDSIIALHGGGDGSVNRTSLSIQVDNVAAACTAIAVAGGTIVTVPETREGEPIMLGTFRDTEGNEVMLTEFVG